jgi:hypothetical protein
MSLYNQHNKRVGIGLAGTPHPLEVFGAGQTELPLHPYPQTCSNSIPLTSGLSLRACWQLPLIDGGRAIGVVLAQRAHQPSPCAGESHGCARGGESSVDTYVWSFFVPHFENNCFQCFSKHQRLQAGLGIDRVNPVAETGTTLYRKGSDSVNFDLSSHFFLSVPYGIDRICQQI